MNFFAPELGGTLTSAALSFVRQDDGTLSCYIGAVQGREGPQEINVAAKAMYGLRPKALVVFAIQEVVRSFGATAIYGVGSRIQAHRKKCLVYLSSLHGVSFDYDRFWTELGGVRQHDEWFLLPLQVHRRSKDEITANKRSMYARRYALMDELASQIVRTISFGALKEEHPTGASSEPILTATASSNFPAPQARTSENAMAESQPS